MSYKVIHNCNKEHHSYAREIICKNGSTVNLWLGDLCPGCYTDLVRALRNQRDIAARNVITLGSVLAAATLGAFIYYVILGG